MKAFTITIILFFVTQVCLSQNLLNSPESIVYDSAHSRYLVSNWEDGKIIAIDESQQQQIFKDTLLHVAGLHINDNVLYACSYQGALRGIVGFDLFSTDIVFHLQVPGMSLPNGITSDTSGNLYVTDYFANKIFKINISDSSSIVLVDSGLDYPNGAEFDHINNRLLVINEGMSGAPILAVDINSGTMTTLVETNISSTDGLTIDNAGNIYFSSWSTGRIYHCDSTFTNPPESVSSGHSGPADIFYNELNNIMAVPNFNSNSVDFVQLVFTGNNEIKDDGMGQNRLFPNPFSNQINFDFYLPKKAQTEVCVYNILGEKVAELLNDELDKGNHSLNWSGTIENGSRLESGIYFLYFNYNNQIQSFKIIKN